LTLLFILIVAFAFFAQSIMGFGGGLIAVPLLSLFLPIQDAVTVVILFQVLIGLLVFKTHRDTSWNVIWRMLPAMVLGVIFGILSLKYIHGDIIRLIFAAYIIVHLLRIHTSFDPFKSAIERGGRALASFLGGSLNAMVGGGGPPFALYFKELAMSPVTLRANLTAILFLSNIPRIFGSYAADFISVDLLLLGATAIPAFLVAIFLGQKLHDKIPQKTFLTLIDVLLVCTVLSLLIKVAL